MLFIGDNHTRVALLVATGQPRLERGCCYPTLHPLSPGLDMKPLIAGGVWLSLAYDTVSTVCPGGGCASQATMGGAY